MTGFASIEYGMSGKWLELLKQISPSVTRAAVIRDPSIPSGSGQLGAIQAVGPFLGVEVTPIDAREAREIERAITDFARLPNGGSRLCREPECRQLLKLVEEATEKRSRMASLLCGVSTKRAALVRAIEDACETRQRSRQLRRQMRRSGMALSWA